MISRALSHVFLRVKWDGLSRAVKILQIFSVGNQLFAKLDGVTGVCLVDQFQSAHARSVYLPGPLAGRLPKFLVFAGGYPFLRSSHIRIGRSDRGEAEKLCHRLAQAGGACVVYKTPRR